MPKAVWVGSLAFGLVTIPVRLYPATEPRDVRFHLMDAQGRRVPELGVGRDAAEMDGEERRSEERGDPAPQLADRRRWSPHVELDRRIPDRIEEPEALDVVGMQMRDEDVDPFRMIASQRHAERADTGTGIEDQQRAIREVDRHARGLPAEPNRLGPG